MTPIDRRSREAAWRACLHDFHRFFGPVLRCRLCGAQTMISVDGQPKAILPPPDEVRDDTDD